MDAHIDGKTFHTSYRELDMNLRGLTALFGHINVKLDPVKESVEEQRGFTHYIRLHKQIRPLLHSGNSVHLDIDDNAAMQSHNVLSQDKKAIFFIAQLALATYTLNGNLRLTGLIADKQYKIEILDLPNHIDRNLNGHAMKSFPKGMITNTIPSGYWLINIGLLLPVLDPATGMLVKMTTK
jgi:Alpha-galactosidase